VVRRNTAFYIYRSGLTISATLNKIPQKIKQTKNPLSFSGRAQIRAVRRDPDNFAQLPEEQFRRGELAAYAAARAARHPLLQDQQAPAGSRHAARGSCHRSLRHAFRSRDEIYISGEIYCVLEETPEKFPAARIVKLSRSPEMEITKNKNQ